MTGPIPPVCGLCRSPIAPRASFRYTISKIDDVGRVTSRVSQSRVCPACLTALAATMRRLEPGPTLPPPLPDGKPPYRGAPRETYMQKPGLAVRS